jgi:ABC-type bacteriocin/lantibiotic exporter with double-glycine peptidase domain
MAVIKYQVPLFGQANANSCWNASAEMIWRYWQGKTNRQGPMHTATNAYSRSKETGIYPAEFVTLAENVGLKPVSFRYPISKSGLANLLSSHGPLWCAGYWWGNSSGHVIVVAGISGDVIFVNDPAPQGKGSRTTKGIGVFNSQLAQNVAGCIMYKDPERY